ncbi:MAG: plasmid pRiA4b ORF-3 family protein [Dermatophilaceae bacterium]
MVPTTSSKDPASGSARKPAQQFADQRGAAHGEDPPPGGQDAPQGAAFGLTEAAFAGLGREPFGFGAPSPERRFTLPDPPEQAGTLRVRVDIDEATPPIWRRLDLAGDLTLTQVHTVLQAAFGWFDYHLHSFVPELDGVKDQRVRPFPNDGTREFCDERLPGEGDVRLDQVVSAVGDRLFYEYDFGDSWGHTLQVEQVLDRRRGDPRAACVGGRRAGPPEDVGGIWRYNEIVAALTGDGSRANEVLDAEELSELREWLGEDFDPADPGLDDLDLDGMLRAVERAYALSDTLVGNPRCAPAFAELLERCEAVDAVPVLAALVVDAGLDLDSEPVGAARSALFQGLTHEEAETVVAPWRGFLATIGPDGAELTPAGYLRPAVVETLFTQFGIDSDGIGKGNREDLTPPVAQIRTVATNLGLVRKAKGRLLPTKAAAAAAAATDPIRLWRLIADHLTRGRQEYERQAAVLALLVAAADPPAPSAPPGEPTAAVFQLVGSEVLGLLGWRSGRRQPSGWEAMEWSATVWTVLERSDCLDVEGHVTPAGQRLARAALLVP